MKRGPMRAAELGYLTMILTGQYMSDKLPRLLASAFLFHWRGLTTLPTQPTQDSVKGVKKPELQGSFLLESCPVTAGIFAPREGGGQSRPQRFS